MPNDKTLVVWCSLQHIADESAQALGFESEDGPLDLRSATTQASLKAFEKQLGAWKALHWEHINGETVMKLLNLVTDKKVDSLRIHFHYVRSTMHEICLHHDYDPDEFKPPYLMRPSPSMTTQDLLSPVYTSSLLACTESSQAVLETFVNMDSNMHRSVPVIVYTRSFYALIVLSKLTISAQASDSSIGGMIDIESIRLIEYLYRMMSVLKLAIGPQGFRVPATFYAIVTKLSAWYTRQSRVGRTRNKEDDILEPMKFMKRTDGSIEVESSRPTNSGVGTIPLTLRSESINEQEQSLAHSNAPTAHHSLHSSVEDTPSSNDTGIPRSLLAELSGTLSWGSTDFQHWNMHDGQTLLFDPDLSMTEFDNSAFLSFEME